MKIDKTISHDTESDKYTISRFYIKEGYRDPNCYFRNLRSQITTRPMNSIRSNSKYWYRLFYSANICQGLMESVYTISKMPEFLDYVCFNRQIELGYRFFEEFDGYNDIPTHSRYRGGYAIPVTNFKDVFRYSTKLK